MDGGHDLVEVEFGRVDDDGVRRDGEGRGVAGGVEAVARGDFVLLPLGVAAELAHLSPRALILNLARGGVIDEPSLVEALTAGKIAGAALDTYAKEPLAPDHPLRSAPRTVLTPHLGYVTEDTYTTFFSDAVEDVLAYLEGAPVRVLEA